MAARVLSGLGGGAKSAGSVFSFRWVCGQFRSHRRGAAASSFSAGFASKFKGNSYVRDAVVEGGSPHGSGRQRRLRGARLWWHRRPKRGGAHRGVHLLRGQRPEAVSGAIAGDIADRSLQNFMPQLTNYSLVGTQITGGHIHTTATGMAAQEAAEQEGSPRS